MLWENKDLEPRGEKGVKGEEGAIGSTGEKGDAGPMGRPGDKGSIGLRGNKGNRGFTGIQGPKGECTVPPKIFVFLESQYVFVNKSATFYCWVQGQTSKKTTWLRLGGTLSHDISTEDGVLHISNAQRSHIGSYLCTVFTSYGIFRAVAILGIKGKNYFTIFTFPLSSKSTSCTYFCSYLYSFGKFYASVSGINFFFCKEDILSSLGLLVLLFAFITR